MLKQTGSVVHCAIILLVLSCFHSQTAYALDVNGVISSDTLWTTAQSPVNITGDVLVQVNTTLTIDPGVEVVFQSSQNTSQGYSIKIDGTLAARGNQMQPIVFTAADSSVPWGTIMFSDTSKDWDSDSSTGSVIEYCVIEYGGNEPDAGAMISTFNAMPLIARNAIRFGVGAGILSYVSENPADISTLSGQIKISSNQIYNNATGVLFTAEGGSIDDNYFLNNNRAMDIQVRSNDVQVINNTVFSSASQLFGTGIRLVFDQAANGIAAYQWRQTSGTSVVLNNPQSAMATFNAPDPGSNPETLSFELTITNKTGLKSTETVDVIVVGNNSTPIANAGANRNVQIPQEEDVEITITLSGVGSSDPDLGIAGYAWEQTKGTTVVLQGANTIAPTFVVPTSVMAGDRMTFQLTVTDRLGLTAFDTVDIVYYANNIYPVANAGADQTYSQGDTVILNGTGSSDSDGSIFAYAWEQTQGALVSLINQNTARPYFIAPKDNTSSEKLEFRLQVTDDGGLQNTDDISISIKGSLVADPGNEQTVFAGTQVILDASASVDHNAIANIDIESNLILADNAAAGLIALTANENNAFNLNLTSNNLQTEENKGYIVYTYDWSGEIPTTFAMPDNWFGTDDDATIANLIYDQDDDYKLPAIAYQPFADQNISGTGSSLPYPAIADAGPDQETAADNSVTLDGSNSYDPDKIARYHWQQLDGPGVNLKNADQAIATFIAPFGGVDEATLQFQLTVSTDDIFSHKDTVNVTIIPDEALLTVDGGGCFIQSVMSDNTKNYFLVEFAAIFLICLLWVLHRVRKISPLACILPIALILFAVPARAGYFSAGAGAGGDADEVNLTIETGAKDIHFKNQNLLFGVAIHLIPHSDNNLPEETIASPSLNDDYSRIGSVRKGTEVGFSGKLGLEIGSSDFYVSAIGGFTAYTESELTRSLTTGRTYEESSDSKLEPLYGGGVSYFIESKWDIVLHLDFDNIRGVTGSVGWHW